MVWEGGKIVKDLVKIRAVVGGPFQSRKTEWVSIWERAYGGCALPRVREGEPGLKGERIHATKLVVRKVLERKD